MASITTAIIPSKFSGIRIKNELTFRTLQTPFNIVSGNTKSFSIQYTRNDNFTRLLLFDRKGLGCSSHITSAVGSGLEASISEDKDISRNLKDAKVVIESRDDDKIQVRADIIGNETQKVFDDVLENLARAAPPIPGFRRRKGGKTSNVPKDFMLRALGEERVTKFVIQEIVSSTMAEFVKKENITVNKKFKTTQSAEELRSVFSPGNDFGFNAILEIEKQNTEVTSSTPSDIEVLPQ